MYKLDAWRILCISILFLLIVELLQDHWITNCYKDAVLNRSINHFSMSLVSSFLFLSEIMASLAISFQSKCVRMCVCVRFFQISSIILISLKQKTIGAGEYASEQMFLIFNAIQRSIVIKIHAPNIYLYAKIKFAKIF